MKILLVDDSFTMRKIQKNILTQLGYSDLVEANDGMEAIAQLKEHVANIGLILLDWTMPNMDGLTLLQTIKKNDQFKNIPVVMVTSQAEKDKIILALKAGAVDYVVKPFTKEVLEDKIKKITQSG
ncbi:MAG: response regulator [candidate division KSB1 bacterium]|nr:response regulator [candidate division KSB1 bacterium]